MSLEFKKIEVNSIQEMLPFYAMRHNMTCDSVFLESYVWKDYYNVRYAIWENKALLWLMENEGRCFSAMPLCREEDLPGAFAAIEEYFNEELGYPLVINLADEYAVKYLNLPEDKYLVEEQVDSRDYLLSRISAAYWPTFSLLIPLTVILFCPSRTVSMPSGSSISTGWE